jgi:hypothetical protein
MTVPEPTASGDSAGQAPTDQPSAEPEAKSKDGSGRGDARWTWAWRVEVVDGDAGKALRAERAAAFREALVAWADLRRGDDAQTDDA